MPPIKKQITAIHEAITDTGHGTLRKIFGGHDESARGAIRHLSFEASPFSRREELKAPPRPLGHTRARVRTRIDEHSEGCPHEGMHSDGNEGQFLRIDTRE